MSMYAKYENCSLCYGRGWVGEGEGGCMNQCPDCASRRTRDAANSRERKLRDRITELEAQVLALQSWQVVATSCIGKYEEALQEAEAILGGEYAEHYGPMFELAAEARCYSDQCFPQPLGDSNG